jgi:aminopeptidase-like protein
LLRADIEKCIRKLYPIQRSITGEGLRETLDIINEIVPLTRNTYQTGEKLYGGWIIPEEWTFHKAEIKDLKDNVLISTDNNLLHVVNYSQPYHGKIKKKNLKEHVHIGDGHIPYVTSYYEYKWGMCMTQEQWDSLPNEVLVEIDTEFKDGKMDVGYHAVDGDGLSILISSYTCHPQMVVNDLCAMVINAFLAKEYKDKKTRNNYCFLFSPETIGAIAFIDQDDPFDKAIELQCIGYGEPRIYDSPYPEYGGSSRQLELMGIETQTIMTEFPKKFPEYHTSLDNLDCLNMDSVMDAYLLAKQMIELYEGGAYPKRAFNTEPHFGYFGLTFKDLEDRHKHMKTWHMCTGKHHINFIEEKVPGASEIIDKFRELRICH